MRNGLRYTRVDVHDCHANIVVVMTTAPSLAGQQHAEVRTCIEQERMRFLCMTTGGFADSCEV